MIICYCFDKNYAKYCSVSLISLILSNGLNLKLYFVFDETVLEEDLKDLKSIVEFYSLNFSFIRADTSLIKNFTLERYYTIGNYLRLLLPELLESEDLVLYLDCDTIVNHDLRTVWNVSLEKNYYAGVLDELAPSRSKIDPKYKFNYINSGVLLINLKQLREERSLIEYINIHQNYIGALVFVDQCIINIHGYKRKLVSPNQYNHQIFSALIKRDDWDLLNKNNIVLHFSGKHKPWHSWSRIHVAKFWWEYANLLSSDVLKVIESDLNENLLLKCDSLEEYGYYDESDQIRRNLVN